MMICGLVFSVQGALETSMITRTRQRKIASLAERPSPVDELREEALARLYRRKKALDSLIRALEEYQSLRTERRATVIPLRSGRQQ